MWRNVLLSLWTLNLILNGFLLCAHQENKTTIKDKTRLVILKATLFKEISSPDLWRPRKFSLENCKYTDCFANFYQFFTSSQWIFQCYPTEVTKLTSWTWWVYWWWDGMFSSCTGVGWFGGGLITVVGYPVAVLIKVVGTVWAGLAAVGLPTGGTFSCFLHLARRFENHTCEQESWESRSGWQFCFGVPLATKYHWKYL